MSSEDQGQHAQRAVEAIRQARQDRQYDVVLSFAGEDREVARRLAHIAEGNDVRVFLDEFHLWETWGKDLTEYLDGVYGGNARYCVLLVSADYLRKPYTVLERRIAVARALESAEEYVLPVVLDDSWPPGLPRTTAYLDLRTMSIDDVAALLVRKIRGNSYEIRQDQRIPGPTITVLDDWTAPGMGSPLDIADVGIAAECGTWTEGKPYVDDSWSGEPARWTFRGGFGSYPDPIFDITIVNRSSEARLVTRVGIETLGMSYAAYGGLGGGGAAPVLLHRTYVLEPPDLWQIMARKHRADGVKTHTEKWKLRAEGADNGSEQWPLPWTTHSESESVRLPDPVLVDPGRAYRFGLHLFDYTNFCPTEVELVFWLQTDQGEARSERARLSYFIGSYIPASERYQRILGGEQEVEVQAKDALERRYRGEWEAGPRHERVQQIAYQLWEDAGRPAGRDDEFWTAAERALGRDILADFALLQTYKRPM